MEEIWKPIPNWTKYYCVSNKGRVKSLERITKDSIGRVRKRPEQILKPNTDKYGYKYVVFRLNDKSKTYKVHRLVCLCFIGKSKLQVNHKDMNKTNNHISNLEYVTNSQNAIHARKNKQYKPYHFKLSPKDKSKIRTMREEGISYKKIALIYNIHPHTVFKC